MDASRLFYQSTVDLPFAMDYRLLRQTVPRYIASCSGTSEENSGGSITLSETARSRRHGRHQSQASDSSYSPHFYRGIYSRSGLDIMKVMFQVAMRPNPAIHLGRVDASCSIVVCDLALPDAPIIYASDKFLKITRYTLDEILGRNCRFLQIPPTAGLKESQVSAINAYTRVDPSVQRVLHNSVTQQSEAQVQITNFRKNGTPFTNFLSIIYIPWTEGSSTEEVWWNDACANGFRYAVGFQCDMAEMEGT